MKSSATAQLHDTMSGHDTAPEHDGCEFLYKLKAGEVVTTIPKIGFNFETAVAGGVTASIPREHLG